MIKHLLFLLLCLLPSLCAVADDKELKFSDGFFIVNEDWYGHNNSTINWFGNDGEIVRRVVQTVNGQGVQLGCTAPVGAYSGDYMFVTSKQEQDPGQNVVGARLTALDAKTMKFVKKWEQFPNGGDGRDVCGVADGKVYVGSTNGIYVVDTRSLEITGRVKGTEREDGALYLGQIGTIISVGGKAYAVSQSSGLLVIDLAADSVMKSIPIPADAYDEGDKEGSFSFGSVVYKSGYLWLSVSAVSGSGEAKNLIVRYDPATGDMKTIRMPEGCYGPANSWYAWTPDGFCASTKDDYLFWNGGTGSWFAKQTIFRYDIKTGETKLIIDLQSTNDNLNGACLRPNPMTGDIILGLSMGQPYGNIYEIRVYSADGDLRYTYDLADGNYWFPSIPVFPRMERKLVADCFSEAIVPLRGDKMLDVTHAAHDNYLIHALMGKSVASVADTSIVDAVMDGDNNLRLTGKAKGKTTVSLKVATDADTVMTTIPVSVMMQYLISAEAVTPGTLSFSGLGFYSPGDTAHVVAEPAYGYEFIRWTDGVATAERNVIAQSDTTLKAEARKRKFTLTVKAGKNGSVSPEGEMDVVYLDTVALKAVPDEHYVFARWSDGVKMAERQFVVTKDQTISASFEGKPDSIFLSVMPQGAGTVSGSKTVKYGSKTNVRATAAKGYKFVRWSDGGTTTGRYAVGQGSNIELTAIFEPIPYTLTVEASPAEGGKVLGGGTYDYGTEATLTAEAAAGYVFAGWLDGFMKPERTLTVTSNQTFVATFEQVSYTLTVEASPAEGGKVLGGGSYTYGTEATLTAEAAEGYAFAGWSDGVLEAERTLTVTSDLTLVANFETKPTRIGDVDADDNASHAIYDLSGRRLRNADGCRVYIQDGRLRLRK